MEVVADWVAVACNLGMERASGHCHTMALHHISKWNTSPGTRGCCVAVRVAEPALAVPCRGEAAAPATGRGSAVASVITVWTPSFTLIHIHEYRGECEQSQPCSTSMIRWCIARAPARQCTIEAARGGKVAASFMVAMGKIPRTSTRFVQQQSACLENAGPSRMEVTCGC